MSDFPRPLLVLAFVSIIPLLLSPLYLFGAHPFGTGGNAFVRFLLYLLTQLLWFVPLVLFFVSLDQYRRGWTRRGWTLAAVSAVLSAGGLCLIFLS